MAHGSLSQSRGVVGAHDASNSEVESRTPSVIGQTFQYVYIDSTGHTLSGLFLDYWRANGASTVYGDPVSEPFIADIGHYSQAFENGIFQYRPEFLDSADPIVRLMPIDQQIMSYVSDRANSRDVNEIFGGSDAPVALKESISDRRPPPDCRRLVPA